MGIGLTDGFWRGHTVKATPGTRGKLTHCQLSKETVCPQTSNWNFERSLWPPSPGLAARMAFVWVMAPGGRCQDDAHLAHPGNKEKDIGEEISPSSRINRTGFRKKQ